ncbi:protein O-mannosyl-transferase 1-like isoform X2 [Halichondria panicea]|uniref:protein O-mannosyl-transferase 1-like isoform X2 n=1 Tax=Halichondria panicea TaxID=6063 RepID=UPI00312B5FA6
MDATKVCEGNEDTRGVRRRVQGSDKGRPVQVTNISASTVCQETRSPTRKLSRSNSGLRLKPVVQAGRPGQPTRSVPTTWFQHNEEGPPLTYKMEVNLLLWLLVGVGFAVRFWKLDCPRNIIFDEVHFGKFASYYLQRTFFFDVHPPLGKLLFAGIGYLAGYDGSFLFPSIGVEFPFMVPYIAMRGASALCGSLLIPCVYSIMLELGFSHRAALLAGFFTIFENSLVLQSRVIMLDSFLILFTYLSLLCFLKFYHQRHAPFSPSWHKWLAYTGLALGLMLGVKYSGLLGLGCVGLLTLCDLWQLLADKAIDVTELALHVLLRGVYLLGIPLLMNIIIFYVHFLVLNQAGPGNSFVSLPFRNSLQGSVETPLIELSSNATLIRYNSNFTLRSTDVSCWLHSHDHLYPLKYADGRGSSYQQQVTCYDFKDPNNAWTIRKPAGTNDSSISEDIGVVRNGDEVEVVHLLSGKLLNSHDVAAPLSPTLQEVAGYINYSAAFVPHVHWKVSVVGLKDGDPVYWEPGRLRLKLHHTFSKQALACTGKRLPEWAFQQYEVVTDKAVEGSQTIWTMEDLQVVRGDNKTRDEEEAIKKEWISQKQANQNVEFTVSDSYSFLEKYLEIQHHMLTAHGSLGDHAFGTPPHNWPLLSKTLPYWLDETSNSQVTLMGNPLLWWAGCGGVALFLLLSAVYALASKRLVYIIQPAEFEGWLTRGGVLVGCWLVHFLPYFLLSRVLFLHHYLPSLPCQLMLLAALCDHLHIWTNTLPPVLRMLYPLLVILFCVCVVASFLVFAPFTYGFPSLSVEQIKWRHWIETWDLLFHMTASS